MMRILLHSPKDMVAGALAFAAVIAIIANALFLQAGRHPAPMFGTVVVMPAGGADVHQSVAASAPGRSRRIHLRAKARGIESGRAQSSRSQSC